MIHRRIIIPDIAVSMSLRLGLGLFLRSVYIDITMPGLQNPHCVPWLKHKGYTLLLP